MYIFKPSDELASNSNITRFMLAHRIEDYRELIKRSASEIEWYWDAVCNDLGIEWFKLYSRDSILDTSHGIEWARWFTDGKCNIAYNCLDRHVKAGKGSKPALIWENEQGAKRVVTYSELYSMSCRIANALSPLVRKGDVVCIYMPMVPEAIASILACSRIGAVHSVVFSGFSARALADRLNDSRARVLITADGYYRRGKPIALKSSADEALGLNDTVESVIVHEYSGMHFEEKSRDVTMIAMSSILKEESSHADCAEMDAEDRLFILYTSGTTGKPKGTVHVHGGFTVFVAQQAAYLIDMKESDVLFWPADIGWITGQTWSVYGSLMMHGTTIIYDGALDYPSPDRALSMVDDHNVTILGMAPTALRAMMRSITDDMLNSYDMDTLRILACTGEVVYEDEWFWYFERVGHARCPVINLSGGTEVGGAILSVLPVMQIKPCTVGVPVPGFDADVVDDHCNPVRGSNNKGYLVIRKPWPSMTRGILNDPARYIEAYWARFKGVWFHGDYASIDDDGLWFLHGRVDDVIKVAGHRLSSAEIESILGMHEAVAESAVIGVQDELKGEKMVAYVVLKPSYRNRYEMIRHELMRHVESAIGKIARLDRVLFVDDLPKTRSGKVMRRLVKAKALCLPLGDTSSIENPASLEALDRAY